MKIKFCGAARNVTGSRHLLEINGLTILLDCGMVQGGNREKTREQNEHFLFEPSQVDFVLISHGHTDHIGMLPRLVKQGFKGKVYCTAATKEIGALLLLDSAHIQVQDAADAAKEFNQVTEPLYTEKDAQAAIAKIATFEYRQKFRLAEGLWVTFYDAGHVLGSAITVIDYKEDGTTKRLVFTGDLGRKYMPILNDPYQVVAADTLILESTYATQLHDSFSGVKEQLAAAVNRVVERQGKIIIPGFSFERTQELVYVLHELYNENKIPKLPIYVDSPLSSKISAAFEHHQDSYDNETFREFLSKRESPFYFEQVHYLESIDESKQVNTVNEPCIIIAASGMCDAGRIQHHLKHNIADAKNMILVVGFMAEGSRGRQIVDGADKIRIFGQLYPLKAEVLVMNAFSAHADRMELTEYVRGIHGLSRVFLVHGEEAACLAFRDNLVNNLKFSAVQIEVPTLGQEFTV